MTRPVERPAAVILAAGLSRRFQGDKLRASWGSESLFSAFLRQWPYECFQGTWLVTRPDLARDYESFLARLPLNVIVNEAPEAGQGRSIRLGAAAALSQPRRGLMFATADMPLLTPRSVKKLIGRWRRHPSWAAALGDSTGPVNPVIFPSSTFEALLSLDDYQTGKSVLRHSRVPLDELIVSDAEVTDVDTRGEFSRLLRTVLPLRRAELRKALVPAWPSVTAFVGGGGKTSAIYLTAQALADEGRPVVITTTTHMAPGPLKAEWRFRRPARGEIFFWARQGAEGRLTAPEDLESFLKGADPLAGGLFILVEADGSKGLPVKAPAAHEPALPGLLHRIVWVCNPARAMAGPLRAVAHRPELISSLLGMSQDEVLTCEALAALAKDGQGGSRGVCLKKGVSWRALLTGHRDGSEPLAALLGPRAVVFDALEEERDGRFLLEETSRTD